MSNATRTFVVVLCLIAASLSISALFYSRSRTASFDRHADAIAAIGRVRHLDKRLAELVLAARFGLVNQYDSLTAAEESLGEATRELHHSIGAVVELDPELLKALEKVDEAVALQRRRIEQFKAENSVLKNSLRYLPTAAEDAIRASSRSPAPEREVVTSAVHRLLQAALVYDLIGDRSTSDAFRQALGDLEAKKDSVASEAKVQVDTLLSHAKTLGEKQVSVDMGVKGALDGSGAERLSDLEAIYHRHFGAVVATSNRYRVALYAWSLIVLAAASIAGLELRRLYANLERLVAERTTQVRGALDALWGEMRLASKIQQALVPETPELANCEIAATMKATDAVGGDYYDVIRAADADWVLIGDVSGHGVPAGLIMMMCHTAVRTLLSNDPTIMPDRLLVAVNSVLVENIRQLGESKYMTISALRHERDGTVFFSGAHQDIQIFRASTNSVETIETSGVWLGLKAEIGDKMSTNRFTLAEGDVLLLHTDGITEAMRDGEMFDTDGVQRVLRTAQHKTASEILSAVFAALDGYRLTDDATVLAIRQLRSRAHSARREDITKRASRDSIVYEDV